MDQRTAIRTFLRVAESGDFTVTGQWSIRCSLASRRVRLTDTGALSRARMRPTIEEIETSAESVAA